MSTPQERWALLWARKRELQAERRRLVDSLETMQPEEAEAAAQRLASNLEALERDLQAMRLELIQRQEEDDSR